MDLAASGVHGLLHLHTALVEFAQYVVHVLDELPGRREFLLHLHRRGFAIPEACLSRDWSQPYERNEGLLPVFKQIYESPDGHWDAYEMCEKLVDIEDQFQLWRFRHMRTVQRTIGFKRGTGGSSGVAFLKRALELTFFPELFDVRTEIGQP